MTRAADRIPLVFDPRGGPKEGSSDPRLEALSALARTELFPAGLGDLLVRWTMDTVPVSRCVCSLERDGQPRSVFEGMANRAGAVVVERDEEFRPPDLDRAVRVPIVHGERRFGELAFWQEAPFAFAEEGPERRRLADLVERFGFFLSLRASIEQARELALRDELTGLYNRRYLRLSMDEWVPKARRERRPISLFLLDVDHFKHFNDTWGHATGDRVLKLLGGLMQSLFRAQDVVCRYGGEEFAVLLCDHRSGGSQDHPTEVLHFAERLRRAAMALELTAEDGRVLSQITISGGIATFPWDASSADELIERADAALYLAKRSGRNRVYFARSDLFPNAS